MSQLNLMIIDSDPIFCNKVKGTFAEMADNIYIAKTGKEAILGLRQYDVHCVICDINIPEIDGLKLILHIKKEDDKVPFILFSSFLDPEKMLQLAKLGAYEVVKKPNLSSLEQIVSNGLLVGFERKAAEAMGVDFAKEYAEVLQKVKT